MAESGNFFHMGIESNNELISGARIVPSNARANGGQAPLGGAVTISVLAAMVHLPIA